MYVYNYYIFLRIVHFMSPNLESALLDANMASSASLKIDLLEVTFFFYPFTACEVYLLQPANTWVLVFNPIL